MPFHVCGDELALLMLLLSGLPGGAYLLARVRHWFACGGDHGGH